MNSTISNYFFSPLIAHKVVDKERMEKLKKEIKKVD